MLKKEKEREKKIRIKVDFSLDLGGKLTNLSL